MALAVGGRILIRQCGVVDVTADSKINSFLCPAGARKLLILLLLFLLFLLFLLLLLLLLLLFLPQQLQELKTLAVADQDPPSTARSNPQAKDPISTQPQTFSPIDPHQYTNPRSA
jgi:hypothetical protein